MKKLIILFSCLIIFSFTLFAVPEGSSGSATLTGELTSESSIEDKQAYLEVKLGLGVDEEGNPSAAGQKVIVGFSNDVSNLSVIKVPTGDNIVPAASLTPDSNTATASLCSDLYVFWSVQSGLPIKIKMSVSGQLMGEKLAQGLDWTVSEGETPICGSKAGEGKIYTHEVGEGKPMGKVGYKKLNITTVDYSKLPADVYSAYLYVTVSND